MLRLMWWTATTLRHLSAIKWFLGEGEKPLCFLRRGEGRKWHVATFRCIARPVTLLSNNGHRAAPALNCPGANDPTATWVRSHSVQLGKSRMWQV